ncbi:hypothetical protein HI914_00458 [Erysiphe necator]|nr:hypothetical protein HI914_00458 [Erysiphe necator]
MNKITSITAKLIKTIASLPFPKFYLSFFFFFFLGKKNFTSMGGINLEVFKFGMYIMFPIAIMYYYGTNLDNRFSVPGFWPKPEESHRIPFDRDEIKAEMERLRKKRLDLREKRLRKEAAQKDDKEL